MCSNMYASPVSPCGSCTEPTSTWVKNENTGASGRSQTKTVSPLGSFLTVMRFSKDARSCAAQNVVVARKKAKNASWRDFMKPPRAWTNEECRSFEITWPKGRLSNLRRLVGEALEFVICLLLR